MKAKFTPSERTLLLLLPCLQLPLLVIP